MEDLKLAGVQIGGSTDHSIMAEGCQPALQPPDLCCHLGSHIGDWNLDAPELEPFWEACEATQAAVLIHPWDMEMGGRYKDYWAPWLIGTALRGLCCTC